MSVEWFPWQNHRTHEAQLACCPRQRVVAVYSDGGMVHPWYPTRVITTATRTTDISYLHDHNTYSRRVNKGTIEPVPRSSRLLVGLETNKSKSSGRAI